MPILLGSDILYGIEQFVDRSGDRGRKEHPDADTCKDTDTSKHHYPEERPSHSRLSSRAEWVSGSQYLHIDDRYDNKGERHHDEQSYYHREFCLDIHSETFFKNAYFIMQV